MPYLIETTDKPNSLNLRLQVRQAHLEFLEQHKALLLACGAKLHDNGGDQGGGIYILDVDTRPEAEAFIQQDPFYRADLFAEVRIVRWRKAYLDGECCL